MRFQSRSEFTNPPFSLLCYSLKLTPPPLPEMSPAVNCQCRPSILSSSTTPRPSFSLRLFCQVCRAQEKTTTQSVAWNRTLLVNEAAKKPLFFSGKKFHAFYCHFLKILTLHLLHFTLFIPYTKKIKWYFCLHSIIPLNFWFWKRKHLWILKPFLTFWIFHQFQNIIPHFHLPTPSTKTKKNLYFFI